MKPRVNPSLDSPRNGARASLAPSAPVRDWVTTGCNAAGRSVPAQAPCDLVKLGPLMERSAGRADVVVALIDGPVAMGHPDLARENVREIAGRTGDCAVYDSAACFHGTFVAGILSARRGSAAPALCPRCTLVVRPIFSEGKRTSRGLPAATPQELATAILECIHAGARVVNLSAALAHASAHDKRDLQAVLDHACRRGVVVVAASGNEALMGGSVITRHPWVVPVVGYSLAGQPTAQSNLGTAIGRRGLGGPAEGVRSLSPTGGSATSGGTSVAAPFVAGACAQLLSAFPRATGAEVRLALMQSAVSRRRTVVPPCSTPALRSER